MELCLEVQHTAAVAWNWELLTTALLEFPMPLLGDNLL